jgi:hypothetical protein
VQSILDLLGSAVLLPCKGKRPARSGWQNTTADMMQDSAYMLRLERSLNIGVLLGKPSGGLCAIDIDSDEEVAPFFYRNAELRKSFRVKGARGEKIFVRIEGAYPGKCPLNRGGKRWGDWLATGGQAIIAGPHPTAFRPYRLLEPSRPLLIPFVNINFGALDSPFTHTTTQPWPEQTAKTEHTA